MPDLIRTRTLRARKPHACMTCHQNAVQVGETYDRATYTFDGRLYDWINCAACDEAKRFVIDWMDRDADEGLNEECFEEWARDVGWSASVSAGERTNEETAALAFLVRYSATVVDHMWVGVAGHPDDPECTHRGDGEDLYCGRREDEHLWSTR